MSPKRPRLPATFDPMRILKFLLRVLLKLLKFLTFFLPYVYVLRFPILTWLLLVLLPYYALKQNSVGSILRNLFDLTETGMFPFTLAAFTTSWTVMLTATLILIYSDARFGFISARELDRFKLFRWRYALPFFGLSAVPMIWVAFRVSGGFTWGRLFYTVLGLLVSLLLLLLAYVAQLWLVNPKVLKESPTLINPYVKEQLGAPLTEPEKKALRRRSRREDEGTALERFFVFLAKANPFGGASERLRNLFRNVAPKFGEGYFKYDKEGKVEAVLPNHGFAIFLFMLSAAVYNFIGVMKSSYMGANPNPYVPTLAYVLLLAMLLCWGLSGLSFFFDRFRIPVLLLLACWVLVTSLIPLGTSDYFYQTRRPAQGLIPLAPAEIVRRRNPAAVVLVAANGGGIQASAWAARVLVGLVEECRRELGSDCQEFARSIYLISATSGGSVGSMYFVNAYTAAGLPSDAELEKGVVEPARRSSLDEVAWGLVYPDFQHALFPFIPRTSDRGVALEQALAAGTELREKSLTDWREGVRDGWRPATVFNATITETGEPFLLGTTDITAQGFSGKNFSHYYPGLDISVVTAARLSASFPYVSPAARADTDGPSNNRLHVVDGGYYDNYGMSTLVEWLDQALHAEGNQIRNVLVIQIRGAPTAKGRSDNLGEDESWVFQTYAPLSTIVGVRDGGQISHNNIEFNLLKRASAGERSVAIESAIFEYDNPKPAPLSWRLTAEQKRDIDDNWRGKVTDEAKRQEWVKVREFIRNYLMNASR